MLILSNEELEAVCDMPQTINALYQGLHAYSQGDAVRRPRIDLFAPVSGDREFSCFSTMDGLVRNRYYALRVKPDILSWPVLEGKRRRVTYCKEPGLYGGLVLVYRAYNAELVAIMNDGYVQHMRVGALAALGTRYLARQDTSVLGMIGSGGMARSFALGIAAVRPIQMIRAYSPTQENLRAYCDEMRRKLGIEVVPVDSVEDAVRSSDIVASCTNSMEPVLLGRWLEPGMHVAAVSSWELDAEAFSKLSYLGYLLQREPLDVSGFQDDNFEIRTNVMAYVAGSPEERAIIPPAHQHGSSNIRQVPCVDWPTGRPLGRQSDEDITCLAELAGSITGGLASAGIQGLQFASIAGKAYELALAAGLGKELPTEWFLQDIPT